MYKVGFTIYSWKNVRWLWGLSCDHTLDLRSLVTGYATLPEEMNTKHCTSNPNVPKKCTGNLDWALQSLPIHSINQPLCD